MSKTERKRKQLEEQFLYQRLNEQGATGYLHGVQEPVIKLSKAKGRKVTINGYTLACAILEAIKSKNKDRVSIILGNEKELIVDLVTREVVYFNDRTCEESYLDNIEFYEEL